MTMFSTFKLTILISLLSICSAAFQARAQEKPPISYEVESIEILGTTRITVDQLREHLAIKEHSIMSDEWKNNARTRLLGLGIFKDVLFSLKRGSKPGLAKLILKFEDDDDVLSDWAVGGEFGLSLTEPTPGFGDNSVFRGYRMGLVARNILRESHRAAILTDIDSRGNVVYGQFAYGLPRFLFESIQFDTAITIADPTTRYFDTEGFGEKIQSLWTRQRKGFDIAYGAAWYSNTHSRYKLNDFPEIVAGPKVGIIRETRFLSFIPHEGYRVAASLVPSLINRNSSVLETEVGGTFVPWDLFAVTVSGKSINTGRNAVSTRAEAKIEIPLSTANRGLKSLFYVAIQNGQDHYKDTAIVGTETVAGYRYHSTGFIGDVNFRIVGKNPWKKTLGDKP